MNRLIATKPLSLASILAMLALLASFAAPARSAEPESAARVGFSTPGPELSGNPLGITGLSFSADISMALSALAGAPQVGVAAACAGASPVAQTITQPGCQSVTLPSPSYLRLAAGTRAVLHPTTDCSGAISVEVRGDTDLCSTQFNDASPANDNVRTVFITPGLLHDEEVARDGFASGLTYPPDFPALPAQTAVTALHRLDGAWYFALETTTTLPGGLTATPLHLVTWSPGAGFGLVDASGIIGPGSGPNPRIDAFTDDGGINGIFSFNTTVVTPQGVVVDDEDLVAAGANQLFFDASAAGIDPGLNLDAAHYDPLSQHLFVSFDSSGAVNGIIFDDEDVLEYDLANSEWVLNLNTTTRVAYDGSVRDPAWGPADLDALYIETTPPTNIPVITSVTPPEVIDPVGNVMLTVRGNRYCADSQVYWAQPSMALAQLVGAVNSQSPVQLTITIPAAQFAAAGGVHRLQIRNPVSLNCAIPGASNIVNMPVRFSPVLTQAMPLTPRSAREGSASFKLVVAGNHFCTEAFIDWLPAGAIVPTTIPADVTGGAEAAAEIAANLLATAGTVAITVRNAPTAACQAAPLLPGGVSNSAIFMVDPLPSFPPAAGPPFTTLFYISEQGGDGDRLVVGGAVGETARANFFTILDSLPLPTVVDEKFSGLVELLPGLFFDNVFLPKLAERQGVFSGFDGSLYDPLSFPQGTTFPVADITQVMPKGVFPSNQIPLSRIPGLFAFRFEGDGPAEIRPVITAIDPASAIFNSPNTQLTVTGFNFCEGSVVSFVASNETVIALNTVFVNKTQLTATIPTGLLARPGGSNPPAAISYQARVDNRLEPAGCAFQATSNSVAFSVTTPNVANPQISAIFNSASFGTGPVSPGYLVSVQGPDIGVIETQAGFAALNLLAGAVPLPTTLGGYSLLVNGRRAPLLFVGAFPDGVLNPDFAQASPTGFFGQINAQIPWETVLGNATIVVQREAPAAGGVAASIPVAIQSAPFQVQVAAISPSFFTFQFGPGPIAGQNFKLNASDGVIDASITQPTGSIPGAITQPAPLGGLVILYANGLGPLDIPIASGSNSLDELRRTRIVPKIFIGGVEAELLFAGLAPQFVGLYQINVLIPFGTVPGDQVPVVIQQGGLSSRNDATIAVRP